jgi:hypothetical protein
MTNYFFTVLAEAGITLGSEGIVYFFFARKDKKFFFLVSAFSLVSNVIMNSLLQLIPSGWNIPLAAWFLVAYEIFTTLIEGLILSFSPKIKSYGFLISLLANALSLGVGLLCDNYALNYLWIIGIVFFVLFIVESGLIFVLKPKN